MSSLMTRGGLFDDFFKDIAPGFYVRPLHGDPLPSPAQIKVDVKETDKGYTVEAEVPGVSKDEIHVSLDGNVVTLRAEVKQEDRQGSDEKVLRSERYFGAVSRSFQLPMDIDQAQAFLRERVMHRGDAHDPADALLQHLAGRDLGMLAQLQLEQHDDVLQVVLEIQPLGAVGGAGLLQGDIGSARAGAGAVIELEHVDPRWKTGR